METPAMSAAVMNGREIIHETILGTLGNTPLERLNRVTSDIKAQPIAKVEFFNPGGSVKDRIGLAHPTEQESFALELGKNVCGLSGAYESKPDKQVA